MAETYQNLDVFLYLAEIIFETSLCKLFLFWTSKYSQCILGAFAYALTLKQTLLVVDVVLINKIQLTGNHQLLPSS